MDLPDSLSPPISIVHRSREVFQAITCIGTELLDVGSSWSSCLCSSMWRGPLEYIAYEFVLTSPAVTRMSGSSKLDSFVMGGRWPYNCCFVGCCLQDLFHIARSILAFLPSSFFSIRLISVHVLHPYSSMDTNASWKKLHFIYRSGLTSIWPIVYR